MDTLILRSNIHTNIACDECDKVLESPYKLKKHKLYKHERLRNEKMCEFCGKSFAYNNYKTHIKKHEDSKWISLRERYGLV